MGSRTHAGAAAARGQASKAKPKKVAFESLTATEAVWHMAVLIAFAAVYLIMVVMVRFSVMARMLAILIVMGVAGLVAAVLTAFTMSHRSSALQKLRSAIASGDAKRIREAIWRAEAAGVSAEDAAAMQELQSALSGKLRNALADRDVEKLGMAVRCAKAVQMAGDKFCAAVEMLRDPSECPQGACRATPALARVSEQRVGRTSDEVDSTEKLLPSSEQDSPRLRVVVQRPHSPPAVTSDGCGNAASYEAMNETLTAIQSAVNTNLCNLDQDCPASVLSPPVASPAPLLAADAPLLSTEARQGPPRRPQAALRLPSGACGGTGRLEGLRRVVSAEAAGWCLLGASPLGLSPQRKMTFVDESC